MGKGSPYQPPVDYSGSKGLREPRLGDPLLPPVDQAGRRRIMDAG